MAAETSGTEATEAPAPKFPIKQLILPLLSTVSILAALGTLIYTRMVYKRPPITETGERERLAKAQAKPPPATAGGTMEFEPVTVNIQSIPTQPKPADGTQTQLQGKLHYVTMAFALELRDLNFKEPLEKLRPILMDNVLGMLGRKNFHELTTVQGRYVLRTQLMEMVNDVARRQAVTQHGDSAVINVHFTQFIVQ